MFRRLLSTLLLPSSETDDLHPPVSFVLSMANVPDAKAEPRVIENTTEITTSDGQMIKLDEDQQGDSPKAVRELIRESESKAPHLKLYNRLQDFSFDLDASEFMCGFKETCSWVMTYTKRSRWGIKRTFSTTSTSSRSFSTGGEFTPGERRTPLPVGPDQPLLEDIFGKAVLSAIEECAQSIRRSFTEYPTIRKPRYFIQVEKRLVLGNASSSAPLPKQALANEDTWIYTFSFVVEFKVPRSEKQKENDPRTQTKHGSSLEGCWALMKDLGLMLPSRAMDTLSDRPTSAASGGWLSSLSPQVKEPSKGFIHLYGPKGAGKSSLIHTIKGNDLNRADFFMDKECDVYYVPSFVHDDSDWFSKRPTETRLGTRGEKEYPFNNRTNLVFNDHCGDALEYTKLKLKDPLHMIALVMPMKDLWPNGDSTLAISQLEQIHQRMPFSVIIATKPDEVIDLASSSQDVYERVDHIGEKLWKEVTGWCDCFQEQVVDHAFMGIPVVPVELFLREGGRYRFGGFCAQHRMTRHALVALHACLCVLVQQKAGRFAYSIKEHERAAAESQNREEIMDMYKFY